MGLSVQWVIGLFVAAAIASAMARSAARKRRAAFIEHAAFPEPIKRKVQSHYPHLSEEQAHLVLEGLKEYFHVCNLAGRRMVAMPSQVVDVAWHEFIVFTRAYDKFCRSALGRFLHHTPAESMHDKQTAQDGIKRAWRASCKRAGINPKTPKRLPLLFSIDNDLNIADGFSYALDCTRGKSDGYCAGHIGCGGGCTGDSGGCGGDSDGCGGGGCGGD